MNTGTNPGAAVCPLCSAPVNTPPIDQFTPETAARFFCPPFRNADRNRRLVQCLERHWPGGKCENYRCQSCGFAFGWPFVSGNEEFYSILHEQAGYPADRWEYHIAVEHAKARFSSGAAVLDIGAGEGNFFRHLDRWQHFAVESTPTMRKHLVERGIGVFDGLDDAARARPEGFELVTLFQVIEHVSDFRSLLSAACKVVRSGGLIAVSTVNGDEIPRLRRATHNPEVPPNHVAIFTPDNLARAVSEAGFADVQVVIEPPKWSSLLYSMHMRAIYDAAHHRQSLAGLAMRIQSRPLRQLALVPAGMVGLFKMIPHLGTARLSANLVAIAARR